MNARTATGELPELEMTIARTLNASRDLVFSAWTEPEHLEHWQNAPKGFTVPTHEVDFRVGGAFRVCMRSSEGTDHWLQGVYREIKKPERLVFTHTPGSTRKASQVRKRW